MELLTTKHFNGNALDCYVEHGQEQTGDFWATREQIGTLLEYETPRKAIKDIHERHRERLDKFSVVVKLSYPTRGAQNDTPLSNLQPTTLYSFKGLLEICRYSNQPKANDIMDWLFEVADEIRRTGSYSLSKPQETFAVDAAIRILGIAGIKGNQLTLALDKVYRRCAGFSLLETAGIQLVVPTQRQALTPTQIGTHFGASAREINQVLSDNGFQYKSEAGYEPSELGAPYAVMQDTNKRHNDGTPVRQLKWDSSIVEELAPLFE